MARARRRRRNRDGKLKAALYFFGAVAICGACFYAWSGSDTATVDETDAVLAELEDLFLGNALRDAASRGDLETVKEALAHGADPNAFSSAVGTNALMIACQNGHDAVVRVLLNHERCDCDARTPKSGSTAVIIAVQNGDARTLALLAESGNCNLDLLNKNGDAAIHLAADSMKWQCLRILVTNGADMDLGNSMGVTALLLAAKYKHVESIEFLAARGADLTKAVYIAETDSYEAPHHVALEYQHLDALAVLVRFGVDICVGVFGLRDVIVYIIEKNLLDSLRFLVEEAGCPVNATRLESGALIQPALQAVAKDRVEAFTILAKAGADLDIVADLADLAADHGIAPPSLADVAAARSPGILKLLKEEYGREPAGLWRVSGRGETPKLVPVDDAPSPRRTLSWWGLVILILGF